MKDKQTHKTNEKKKVIHFQVRIWWVIAWLLALTVLLIYYWDDLQKALSNPTTP